MSHKKITVYTLVDITPSGITQVKNANTKEYHQQQNLNVLLQTIGMRAQPINYNVKILSEHDTAQYKFSSQYAGKHCIWKLSFDVQHSHVFDNGTDELGLLIVDTNGVAISADLDETAHFQVNIFDTAKNVNTYFDTE